MSKGIIVRLRRFHVFGVGVAVALFAGVLLVSHESPVGQTSADEAPPALPDSSGNVEAMIEIDPPDFEVAIQSRESLFGATEKSPGAVVAVAQETQASEANQDFPSEPYKIRLHSREFIPVPENRPTRLRNLCATLVLCIGVSP